MVEERKLNNYIVVLEQKILDHTSDYGRPNRQSLYLKDLNTELPSYSSYTHTKDDAHEYVSARAAREAARSLNNDPEIRSAMDNNGLDADEGFEVKPVKLKIKVGSHILV